MRPRLNKSVVLVGLVVVGASLVPHLSTPHEASAPSGVRVALVNVPDDVLRPLLPDFQKQAGVRAEIIYTGPDPYGAARRGEADLVISHYGHEGVEPFVTAGLGLWPHPVFANQMALLGPSSDPAHVRGLADAAEAFRRIAQTKSRFLVNNSSGAKYLEEILWTSAGRPAEADWHIDRNCKAPTPFEQLLRRGRIFSGAFLHSSDSSGKSSLTLNPW